MIAVVIVSLQLCLYCVCDCVFVNVLVDVFVVVCW